MFYLEPGDRRPLYEQVKEKMKSLIVKGVLQEHDGIPSVRELAAMLSLNPNTIQRAYRELETEGYLHSIPGKGSFIAALNDRLRERRQSDLLQAFTDLLPEIWYAGVTLTQLQDVAEKFYQERNGAHD